MCKLSDCVGHDVCSISVLIPRLSSNEVFRSTEQHSFYDDTFVEFLIELCLILFLVSLNIVAEYHEVLLSALADNVRQKAPCIFVFCQIHFRNQLLGRVSLLLKQQCERMSGRRFVDFILQAPGKGVFAKCIQFCEQSFRLGLVQGLNFIAPAEICDNETQGAIHTVLSKPVYSKRTIARPATAVIARFKI